MTVEVAKDDMAVTTLVHDRDGNEITKTEGVGIFDLPFKNVYNPEEVKYVMLADKAYYDRSGATTIGDVSGTFNFTLKPVGSNAASAPMAAPRAIIRFVSLLIL